MKSFLLFLVSLLSIQSYAQTFSDQKPIRLINKQDGAILSLAFQNDGKILASGSEDKTCVLWSYPDFKLTNTLTGHYSGVRSIFYTPNGKYVCTAGDRTIRIYTIDGEYINTFGGPVTYIWSVSYNPVTNQMICGSHDKNLRMIDFASGKLTYSFTGHTKIALAVAFSPDGKLIASGSLDETVRIWDVGSKKTVQTLIGHGGNIYAVIFTSDSRKVISASDDNSIRVWDVNTGKTLFNLIGHDKGVASIALSPDNNYLISGSYDSTIKLWDINNGECIYTFNGHTDAVNAVIFHPDGNIFASGSSDKTIQIWELKPEIFVEHYYIKEFEEECTKSGLFVPKGKEETKENYKKRISHEEEFRKEVIQKYYHLYLTDIKGKIQK